VSRSPAFPVDRRTVGLGLLAGAGLVAAVTVEVGRVWRRGSAPPLTESDAPLQAAAEAVAETAEVARTGYRSGSSRENALFNLLASFVTTFVIARGITTVLHGRRSFGPFRDLKLGRRHIHHFVPGITLAFVSGAVAIIARDSSLDRWMAIPFGTGMGLTLDESALLLELDDVYWTEEGVVSVQIALAVTALLAAAALATRFLRRGELAVLEVQPVAESAPHGPQVGAGLG